MAPVPGTDVHCRLTVAASRVRLDAPRNDARGAVPVYVYMLRRFIHMRGNVCSAVLWHRQSKSRTCHMSVRRNLATHQRRH